MILDEQTRKNSDAYNRRLFAPEDEALGALVAAAKEEGLPAIQITSDVGRLLQILALSVGARRALEIGTLGGYSGTWIARGLADGARLVTLEVSEKHRDFAERWFARTGVAERVEVRLGDACETLDALAEEEPFDFIFIDADKAQYPTYLAKSRGLLRPGGLLTADNVLWSGDWDADISVDDDACAPKRGIQRFNAALAADPDFQSVLVPIRAGVAVALKRR